MTNTNSNPVVLIAADDEWAQVRDHDFCRSIESGAGPFTHLAARINDQEISFVHSGCGKTNAAAATQHIIDRWNPSVLINLGTCGGFSGSVEKGDILLVNRTVIYDAHEIDGPEIRRRPLHETQIPTSWIQKPWPGSPTLASTATADQDLNPDLIPLLRSSPFKAVAADWESGAIAYVAARNQTRCLILRGVSDVVEQRPSPERDIRQGIETVMSKLLTALPIWLNHILT